MLCAVLSVGALAARPSLAVTTCAQYGTVDVAGKTYVVQNNVRLVPGHLQGLPLGHCANNSGMPLQVGNIGSATSGWSSSPVAGAWDVA